MTSHSKLLVFILISLIGNFLTAQDIYKTPSGAKYHLASCRMVENVSSKLVKQEDISKYGLEPCKICKPPSLTALGFQSGNNKSKGIGENSVPDQV